MKLQVTPNDWSCIATAFSMALGIPFAQFIGMIGHDGGCQPYDDKRFHLGFHIQECIDICFRLGFACTEIQYYYGSRPFAESQESIPVYSLEDCGLRFATYLKLSTLGVLGGIGKQFSHAVAWDGNFIYDPRGQVYPFEEAINHDFRPQILWMLTKMEPNDVKTILEG